MQGTVRPICEGVRSILDNCLADRKSISRALPHGNDPKSGSVQGGASDDKDGHDDMKSLSLAGKSISSYDKIDGKFAMSEIRSMSRQPGVEERAPN